MRRLIYIVFSFIGAVVATGTLILALPRQAAVAIEGTPSSPNEVTITKSGVPIDKDGDGKIGPGDEIAYSVIATNTGATQIESVGILDVVDEPVRVLTDLLHADIRAIKEGQLVSDANGNGMADPDDEIAYTITVSNVGYLAAPGIRIIDSFPQADYFGKLVAPVAGTTLASQGVFTIYDNQFPDSPYILADLGTINAGASATLRFRVRTRNSIPGSVASINNAARVETIADSPYPSHILTTNQVTTPVTLKVDMSVRMSPMLLPGEFVTRPTLFYIYYANEGLANATGVVITETLPVGGALDIQHSTPGWVCNGNTCTFAVSGTVPPGKSDNVVFVISPTAVLPASVDSITNVVRIGDDGAHGLDPNTANNIYTATVRFGSPPMLTASTQAMLVVDANNDGEYSPGDVISYVITIRNIGTRDANNLRYFDTVSDDAVRIDPSSVAVSQGTKNVGYSYIDGNLGTLAAGAAATITFRATDSTEPPLEVAYIRNQARFTDNYDAITFSNINTVPVYHDYRVRAVKFNSKAPGATLINTERFTYTIVVTNTGSKDFENLRLLDDLSSSYNNNIGYKCMNVYSDTIVSSRGHFTFTENTPNNSSAGLVLDSGVFATGDVLTVTYQAKPCLYSHLVDNQVTILSDTVLLGYSNSISNPVKIPPELYLPKIRDSNLSYATPGQLAYFRMTYGNGGDGPSPEFSPATGVVITAVVPAYSVFDAAASAPTTWDCADGSPTGTPCRRFHPGALPRHQSSGTLTFAVRLNSILPITLTRIYNIVTIGDNGASGTEYQLDNNTITGTVWIGTSPISATHQAWFSDINQNGSIDIGEVATFQTLVTNTSNYSLTNLSFDDYMPPQFFYIYGTAVLTAPDGVFAGMGSGLGPFHALIDVPIPPGGIITATFSGRLDYTPTLMALSNTMPGPQGYVFDEYSALLGTIPPALLPFGTTRNNPLLYGDARANGWDDWSSNTTVNWASTPPASLNGSLAVRVQVDAPYGTLTLRGQNPINIEPLQDLGFWVYGGPGGNVLAAFAQTGDSTEPSRYVFFNAPANTWTPVTIRLSALGNLSQIKRINIQDVSGQSGGVYWLDSIALVEKAAYTSPDYVVYGDALPLSWQSWSYGITPTFNSTAVVQSGTKALAVQVNQPYGTLALRNDVLIDTQYYDELQFDVYGDGAQGPQAVFVQGGDATAPSDFVFFTPPQGAWTHVTIPLGYFGVSTGIKRINIQDASGSTGRRYVVDNVKLARRQSPAALRAPSTSELTTMSLNARTTQAGTELVWRLQGSQARQVQVYRSATGVWAQAQQVGAGKGADHMLDSASSSNAAYWLKTTLPDGTEIGIGPIHPSPLASGSGVKVYLPIVNR